MKPVTASLSSAASKRLLQYGLGIGAAAAAGAPAAGHAQANNPNVVYTNAGNFTATTIYFDLNAAPGGTTVSSTNFAGADFRLYENGINAGTKPRVGAYGANQTNQIVAAARGTAGRSYAVALSNGATIGSLQNFVTNPYLDNTGLGSNYSTPGQGQGDFKAGTSGYIGLKLQPSGSANAFYGWAYLTFNGTGNAAGEFTLRDFAYDTVANEAIPAGQVPEPSSALLLAAVGTRRTGNSSTRCSTGANCRRWHGSLRAAFPATSPASSPCSRRCSGRASPRASGRAITASMGSRKLMARRG